MKSRSNLALALLAAPRVTDQIFRLRMREQKHLAGIEPQRIGKTSKQRQRRPAEAIFDVGDVAGLDTHLLCQSSLGQTLRLARFFNCRTKGFVLHIS